jgi:putative ABC transport system ATP-binding protein
MHQEDQRKLFAREGLKALLESLLADKKLLTLSLALLIGEGLSAAMIPVAKGWMVDDPSIITAICVVVVQTFVVYFTEWFYSHNDVLEASMNVHLSSRVLNKTVQLTNQQRLILDARWGKLHSSVFDKLTYRYGKTIPQLGITVWMVVCHTIGLALAFGWKYVSMVLITIAIMALTSQRTLKENRRYSVEVKKLDVIANQRIDSLDAQYVVYLTTGTLPKMVDSVTRTFEEIRDFYQKVLWKRIKNSFLARIMPPKVATLLILVLAVSDDRSAADLIVIEATLYNLMMQAFKVLQMLSSMTQLEGEQAQIGATLATPPSPEGSVSIKSIYKISLQVDHVTLPGGRVLFPNGLFPNHPGKDLRIGTSEFVCFIGPSGCGKTTVANILSLQYEQGIKVDDYILTWDGTYRMETDVGDVAVADISRTSLWTVLFPAPQRTNWVDGTVQENIELHFENEGLDRFVEPHMRSVYIQNSLRLVCLSPEILSQPISSLSGGEASRVMLARCLTGVHLAILQGRQCVLILDETLSQLDEETAFEVLDLVYGLRKFGVTIIMISHNKKLIPKEATVYRFGKDGAGIVEFGKGWDIV